MCLSPRLIRLVDEVIEDNWPGLPLSDTKTALPSAPMIEALGVYRQMARKEGLELYCS